MNESNVAAFAVLSGTFIMLLLLESLFPLRGRKRRVLQRFAMNIVVSGLGFAVAAVSVKPAVIELIGWTSVNSTGLLYAFALPPAFRFAIGFLLLDLSFYYWHRTTHKLRPLWRLHNVHHIDPDMDVSTSFRFHFVEIFVSTVFRALQVLVIGVTFRTMLVYEVVFLCATMFHHSNLALPVRFERVLNKVFVTPRMHGVHHSVYRNETNSNYSSVFMWWDWLNGTLRLNVPQSQINIGVPGYLDPADNRLLSLLTMPFKQQKSYWDQGGVNLYERQAGTNRQKDFLME